MTRFFYADRERKTVGPVSIDDLWGLHTRGAISDSTLVIEEGAVAWTKFSDLHSQPPNTSNYSAPPPFEARAAELREHMSETTVAATGDSSRSGDASMTGWRVGPPARPAGDYHPASGGTVASRVMGRYADAYRVAWAVVTLGGVIRWLGLALALLVALVGLTQDRDYGIGPAGMTGSIVGYIAVKLSGIIVGVLIGAYVWSAGIIVSAGGQLLRATLDNTVQGSPFLTDDQRISTMGL